MVKMKDRNEVLRNSLIGMTPKKRVVEAANIPMEDSVNREGYASYSLSDELRLISMLNTLKLEKQFYRTEAETMAELRDLIERIGLKDPYFLCQAIVYSRCLGEGMRSINHLAATLAAPFISGKPYAKAFYGLFDKKHKMGGVIYRTDDMTEMKDVWAALNTSYNGKMLSLPNAMKKGFASAIENLDTLQLTKYKKAIIDISNLVHPNPAKSKSEVVIDGKRVKTLDAIMNGITVSADTWEVANSEAGQEVAKALKSGKLTKEEAKEVLDEAKNDNWEGLLNDGKLGILAALRNIRNIMSTPRKNVINKLCQLLSNEKKIRDGLIMPYQIDIAYEIVNNELNNNKYANLVKQALLDGYEKSVPNLASALKGKTCVMVDCSGSMHWSHCLDKNNGLRTTVAEKAGLLAATIAQATNADVVRFGSYAKFHTYDKSKNVFNLGQEISNPDMGGTDIGSAFNLITNARKKYDRIILISDNECNSHNCVSKCYANYVKFINSPYVYCIDLCSYGTTSVKNDGKVNYYFGYGYKMFDDISANEFNPSYHIDKVRKVVVDPNYKTN